MTRMNPANAGRIGNFDNTSGLPNPPYREEMLAHGVASTFRDDFNGTGTGQNAVSAAKWDFTLAASMTASAGSSALAIVGGTAANASTVLVSQQKFSLPFRGIFAWRQSLAKQTGEAIRLEFVAVDPVSGALDENNKVWFETTITGTGTTALQYNTVTDGITATATAATGTAFSSTDNLLEIAYDADQIVFANGAMNSTARTAYGCRDNNLPDVTKAYKLRISIVHDNTFAGSSNTFSIYYATALETTEVQAEITGSRGSGQGIQVAGTQTITEGTLINPSGHYLTAAASTNATSVKTNAGNLYSGVLTNLSASAQHYKFYNKASAPVVGTDVPIFTLSVAANSALPFEFGRTGKRFTTGIAYAITGAQADADTTAIAAGAAKVALSYI